MRVIHCRPWVSGGGRETRVRSDGDSSLLIVAAAAVAVAVYAARLTALGMMT